MASLEPQTDPHPLLPLYRIHPPQTMSAHTLFELGRLRTTYTFKVDARHSEDTVAFLDIKITRSPDLFYVYRDRSPSITVTVGRSADPIATVDSLSIQDTHGSPIGSDMQVSVHGQ